MDKTKTHINKVLNFIITFLIALLIVNVVISFQTTFSGKKYSNVFGYTLFEVKTGSMAKSIEVGDWVLVKATDDIHLNDVITYEESSSFVTHRVVEIYNDTYITKGDANSIKDAPVLRKQVVGKVVKIFPKFGIIKKTLLNPKVLILFIITLLLGCSLLNKNDEVSLLSTIKKWLVKEKKEEKRDISLETEKFINDHFSNTSGNQSQTVVLSKITVDTNCKTLKSLQESFEQEDENREILDNTEEDVI